MLRIVAKARPRPVAALRGCCAPETQKCQHIVRAAGLGPASATISKKRRGVVVQVFDVAGQHLEAREYRRDLAARNAHVNVQSDTARSAAAPRCPLRPLR